MKKYIPKFKGDRVIWAIVVILSCISILAVYSTTGSLAYKQDNGANYYVLKQVVNLSIGFVIVYFVHNVNYTKFAKLGVLLYLISLVLLFYTLFFGSKFNEGSRWISIPAIGITIQTSAFGTMALFIILARILSLKQHIIKDFKKGFLPVLVPVLITTALIAPANLSIAAVLGVTASIVFFIGRVRVKHIFILCIVGIFGGIIIYGISKVTGVGRAATWENRLSNFVGNSKDGGLNDDTYQVLHSRIAIANGGITGVGPGSSTQRDFLPHAYSDFIYAIIVEEYGLIGGAAVAFLYVLLFFRCVVLFRTSQYAFGGFLALSLGTQIVLFAITNMAVAAHLVPVTGIALPIISMNGSSVWFTSVGLGMILSVSRYVRSNVDINSDLTKEHKLFSDSIFDRIFNRLKMPI